MMAGGAALAAEASGAGALCTRRGAANAAGTRLTCRLGCVLAGSQAARGAQVGLLAGCANAGQQGGRGAAVRRLPEDAVSVGALMNSQSTKGNGGHPA